MKCLVIASHLVEELVAEGHTLFGIDSFEDLYSCDVKERNLRTLNAISNFKLIEDNLITVSL